MKFQNDCFISKQSKLNFKMIALFQSNQNEILK